MLVVRYYKRKSFKWMEFYVKGELAIKLCLLYKKLTEEKHGGTGRVFWQTRKVKGGRIKIHGQPLGVHWFSQYPKTMAKLLGYKNYESFSGHSICRSAATIMANSGASLAQMKTWGGWNSNNVPMQYIENSLPMKWNAAQRLENMESGSCQEKSIESTNPCTQPTELSFTTTIFDRNKKPVHKYLSTQNGIKPIPNHSCPIYSNNSSSNNSSSNNSSSNNSSSNNQTSSVSSSNISILSNSASISSTGNKEGSKSKNNKKRQREESEEGENSEYESEEEGEGEKYSRDKPRPKPKGKRQKRVQYVFNITTKNINITQ